MYSCRWTVPTQASAGDRGKISAAGPPVEQNIRLIQAFVMYAHSASQTDMSGFSIKGACTTDLLE